ncbi:hypothetical protein [Alkaliphilus peptidifermentans]|uniref:Uncharacterized protein n=1 Tax=Alkaliphilus peptidifermentans DSM 18978 TaxID=1120976 RepID=A0A1G5GVD7_9FIRM|nr:hypothetical protein [Alkaliphilus peptidifermentans]SCY55140.1 hypothetical protein SAMN03080606_01782 [Alkaliphilus peptidifermentans DSM 18978]
MRKEMNMKDNKLLMIICSILLITCILLLNSNRNLSNQLSQERTDLLISVLRLEGESNNWKISDGVLVNTSNHVHLRIESIDYIGQEDYVSENISITIRFRDKNTGKEEKNAIGYTYNFEELKNFQGGRAGVTYHRDMMEYINHNIVIELKHDDENGNPFLEEIEVIPVWNFEV